MDELKIVKRIYAAGPQGPMGPQGPKGDRGDQGPLGVQGEQGIQGPAGATGPKGEKGDKGDQGILGPKGDKGDRGPRGLTGPRGEKGEPGEIGGVGSRGPKGDPFTYEDFTPEQLEGLRGPRGLKGDKGDTGELGIQGILGIQGEQGIQGVLGPQGEPFSVYNTYASIATMEADSANVPLGKFVMITSNVEDPDNAKLYVRTDEVVSGFSFITDFSGAQGIQGPQGVQGILGLQGPAGQDGHDGTDGQDGAPGLDGHSPVVTASKSGSTTTIYVDGTSIATIDDGLDGQDGQNGTNGTNGTNGLDGVTPHIDSTSKHWMIGSTDTGIVAEGQNGSNGTNGSDGVTPHIDSTTGNWFVGTTDTGVHAQGPAGQDGSDGNSINPSPYLSFAPKAITGSSYTYVDLGLPSGTLWSTMDVGAQGVGYQSDKKYTWGNIEDTTVYNFYNYSESTAMALPSNTTILPVNAQFDAARYNMGSVWRLPTLNEAQELVLYTNLMRGQVNGVDGIKFCSKTDDSIYIFFPCTVNWVWDGLSYASRYLLSTTNLKESYQTLLGYHDTFVIGLSNSKSDLNNNTLYTRMCNVHVEYCYVRGVISPNATEEITAQHYNSIPAAKVAITGDYNDLINKPTIPTSSGSGTQLQADWNLTDNTQADYIKNKPTIPDVSGKANSADLATVATTGSYNDLSNTPTIPDTSNFLQKPIDANGHDYVDFGLPSGTLWATVNIGANSETDYGNYYQYGKGENPYTLTSGDADYNGTENPLSIDVDTARQVFGGNWRMPTQTLFLELIDECTWTWGAKNNVNGYTISKNGKSIFLPAAGEWHNGNFASVGVYGEYYTSTPGPYVNSYMCAYHLSFRQDMYNVGYDICKRAYPVRGVLNINTDDLSKVAATGSYNDLTDKPTIPTIWSGTQAQYTALSPNYDSNTIYIITAS